jgi:hypothetical protein
MCFGRTQSLTGSDLAKIWSCHNKHVTPFAVVRLNGFLEFNEVDLFALNHYNELIEYLRDDSPRHQHGCTIIDIRKRQRRRGTGSTSNTGSLLYPLARTQVFMQMWRGQAIQLIKDQTSGGGGQSQK